MQFKFPPDAGGFNLQVYCLAGDYGLPFRATPNLHRLSLTDAFGLIAFVARDTASPPRLADLLPRVVASLRLPRPELKARAALTTGVQQPVRARTPYAHCIRQNFTSYVFQ